MPRAGFDISKPIFIFDGNSLVAQGYGIGSYSSALDAEFGAGNYSAYQTAVGGQNVDNMDGRLTAYVLPLLNRHLNVWYVCQPGRNQIKQTADTNAQILAKIQGLYQTVKTAVSNTKTACVLTSASVLGGGDYTPMTDISTLNSLISAESSGYIDYKFDLHGHSTFGTIGGSVFQSDHVHYSNPAGMNAAANFVVGQIGVNS